MSRFAALKPLQQGYYQSEVARRLKVCSQTVSAEPERFPNTERKRCVRRPGGAQAATGWKQRERQIARLVEGAEKLGYETPLWTWDRVGHLIQEEFGIRYHSGHA
jgi:transposase